MVRIVRQCRTKASRASGALLQRLPVDFVNLDAGHLRTSRHEIDIVNPAVVALHVDTRGSGIAAGTFLSPNMERRKREILPVHREVEFLVFGVRDLAIEISFDIGRRHGRGCRFGLSRRRRSRRP